MSERNDDLVKLCKKLYALQADLETADKNLEKAQIEKSKLESAINMNQNKLSEFVGSNVPRKVVKVDACTTATVMYQGTEYRAEIEFDEIIFGDNE